MKKSMTALASLMLVGLMSVPALAVNCPVGDSDEPMVIAPAPTTGYQQTIQVNGQKTDVSSTVMVPLRAQGYRQADQLEETLVAQEREDLSYVWDAVKALPVPYREAIHLFYYEGYSTAQIAQILDQKESTVRSRLKRGREKLKPLLEEVGALG